VTHVNEIAQLLFPVYLTLLSKNPEFSGWKSRYSSGKLFISKAQRPLFNFL